MNCQNCNEVIEAGAAFCGNCGQPFRSATVMPPAPPPNPAASITNIPVAVSPIAQVWQNQPAIAENPQPLNGPFAAAAEGVPGYALATPAQHTGEQKALLALLFGVAGIVGALFMAIIGLALGIAGLVMGTMSRSGTKRGLSTAGLFISSLAILASLAVWTYAIKHDPALQQSASQPTSHNVTAPAVSASDLSTPCYSAGFVDKLNVSNSPNSCDMNAFNGSSLDTSTNAYKVYADQSSAANTNNFTSIVKPALEKDVKDSLPGFIVDREQAAQFAGSPAYIINTSDNAQGVALVEAAVLHPIGNGENIFILVHAAAGRTTDLSTLEAQWQWK